MKIFLSSLLILTLSTLFTTGNSFAVSVLKPCSGNVNAENNNVDNGNGSVNGSSVVCKTRTPTSNPVIGAIKIALNVLGVVAGIIAVFEILISGFRLITANGDANTYSQAKESVVYAIIGVIVVAISQSIVIFVLNHIK